MTWNIQTMVDNGVTLDDLEELILAKTIRLDNIVDHAKERGWCNLKLNNIYEELKKISSIYEYLSDGEEPGTIKILSN